MLYHYNYALFIGLQDDRNDFSHPVHADNCILDAKAGECLKESPAFTWRDYRCNNTNTFASVNFIILFQCNPVFE